MIDEHRERERRETKTEMIIIMEKNDRSSFLARFSTTNYNCITTTTTTDTKTKTKKQYITVILQTHTFSIK